METKPPGVPVSQGNPSPAALRRVWLSIRGRILGGLLLVLPILVTVLAISWLYSTLEKPVIDRLATLVLWKVHQGPGEPALPFWFETYAAPVLGIIIALVLLYFLGFFVQSRLRRAIDWVLLRLPVISILYSAVRKVVQALETQPGKERPQRVVLVPFPHPGTRSPAFVTSTCRDIETQKVLLCVYVPTAPIPASGFLLLVPEEDVTEPAWTSEQAMQTIVSAGLTVPPEIRYFPTRAALEEKPAVAPVPSEGTP
jgi:uncharacterized membrane protein